uniref:DDE-1 domain-containing protein n=1 Tax=Peronospora matthiolae TaxID=2874970 RepID=A0AAV1UB04_9STRA
MDRNEKLGPTVIKKSLNLRCFKAIDVSKLPVHFQVNVKAWMDGGIFANWLKAFNLKMSGQNVLLLLDNATSHVNLELPNVHNHFLPPSTTSRFQPMDAGIIRNFKLKYKAQLVQWLLNMVTAGTEDKKLDVLSTIRMVIKLCDEVRPEAIRHCWIHTGIVSGVMAAVLCRQDEPVRPNDLSILDNLVDKLSLSDGMNADDYLECDHNLIEWEPDSDATATSEPFSRDDDSNGDENSIFTHRDALNAAMQFSTYLFAHKIDIAPRIDIVGMQLLTEKFRQQLQQSMHQQQITDPISRKSKLGGPY